MSKEIIVITNGFVLIGDVTVAESTYIVKEASVIRRWGTTKGLGQIALKGPTSTTVLDPCGTVEVEKHATLMRIQCKV